MSWKPKFPEEAVIRLLRVTVLPPAEFDAVNATVYVPEVAYVWLGFCAVDVLASPKSQAHDVGVPVEVSVNCTASGA